MMIHILCLCVELPYQVLECSVCSLFVDVDSSGGIL